MLRIAAQLPLRRKLPGQYSYFLDAEDRHLEIIIFLHLSTPALSLPVPSAPHLAASCAQHNCPHLHAQQPTCMFRTLPSSLTCSYSIPPALYILPVRSDKLVSPERLRDSESSHVSIRLPYCIVDSAPRQGIAGSRLVTPPNFPVIHHSVCRRRRVCRKCVRPPPSPAPAAWVLMRKGVTD
ncbi:hypothetical protein E2C01_019695 [Portunus trituberculatus]|uniref:Uncharacterized protein n=1 Tax=Portunus trituberculatus TaxID=210409 RepID=A0A5B7DXY1_PORTR|nr:hypothetical protein [Portunus trituberculatus]